MVGQVSETGAAVTVTAGLSNPDYYVKNNQAAHFEQVPRAGEGGSTTVNDWVNKTSELSKQSPIEIPSSATVKVQAKNGYNQIAFKWAENGQNYEVRWHTKTPGSPTGQVRTEHILVGDMWIPRYQWQEAINAYRNGKATAGQLQLLKDGHWKAP